jgi:hypothetical protein
MDGTRGQSPVDANRRCVFGCGDGWCGPVVGHSGLAQARGPGRVRPRGERPLLADPMVHFVQFESRFCASVHLLLGKRNVDNCCNVPVDSFSYKSHATKSDSTSDH